MTTNAGFNVVAIYIDAGGTTTAQISAVTVGGVSFSQIVAEGPQADADYTELWAGTIVTGTSATVAITSSATNTIAKVGAAIGVFANLTSNTPTTTCSNHFAGSTNTPYPCSSALTVPASGFAIVGFGYNQTGAITASGSTFISDQQVNVGSTSIMIGHNATAGSLTPSAAGTAFAHGGIVGATWH